LPDCVCSPVHPKTKRAAAKTIITTHFALSLAVHGLAFSSRYASIIGPPYCPFPFCLPARTSEKKLAFLLLELFLGNDAVIPQRGIAAYLLYRISYGGRGIRP
jgi:hypothetical protein